MHLITNTIVLLVNAYTMLIIVYALMSWLPNTTTGLVGQIYRALGTLCDPYLDLFKRFIPPIGGMIDVTPIIALLVLQLVARLIVGIL